MRVIGKFVWYLIAPWLAPFALIPLAILWLMGSIVLGVWSCWLKANGKSVIEL